VIAKQTTYCPLRLTEAQVSHKVRRLVVEPQDRLQHSLAVDEESLLVGRPTDKVILSQLNMVQLEQASLLAVQQMITAECSTCGALILLDCDALVFGHHVTEKCMKLKHLPEKHGSLTLSI